MGSEQRTYVVPGSLLDSGVWVALTFASHPFHRSAGEALRQLSPDRPPCRIRATEISAFRLVTTPTIHRAFGVAGFSNTQAMQYLGMLFAEIGCVEVEEPAGTRELWLRLAGSTTASPKIWMDAYLAAVAIRGDMELITLDSGFREYGDDGLRVVLLG